MALYSKLGSLMCVLSVCASVALGCSSGATSTGGGFLTAILTPGGSTAGIILSTDANIQFFNSGSMCDPVRGLKVGQGGC